jgi:hypothetical protein
MERKLSKSHEELKRFSDESRAELQRNTMTEVSKDINKLIAEKSYVRNFCDTTPPEGSGCCYKTGVMRTPAWILPSLGYIAQDIFETGAEEIYVPLFIIQAVKDWPSKYDEEGRYDVWSKAFEATAHALAEYEEEAFFRVLIPACTTHFNEEGIDPKWAPIAQPNPPAKYCSVELIHRMAQVMQTNGQTLGTVMVSPEDVADIREYTDSSLETARQSYFFTPCGKLNFELDGQAYSVKIIQSNALGIRGRYNINDKYSEFGLFKGNTENKFNDYEIINGNVLDCNGSLLKKGETQIYGFSNKVKDYMKMPIKELYEAYWDPSLSRRNRTGFFGWEKLGAACLINKCFTLGIIDRSEG